MKAWNNLNREHNSCVWYKHDDENYILHSFSSENEAEVTLNWTEEHYTIQWKVQIHTCCLSGSKNVSNYNAAVLFSNTGITYNNFRTFCTL